MNLEAHSRAPEQPFFRSMPERQCPTPFRLSETTASNCSIDDFDHIRYPSRDKFARQVKVLLGMHQQYSASHMDKRSAWVDRCCPRYGAPHMARLVLLRRIYQSDMMEQVIHSTILRPRVLQLILMVMIQLWLQSAIQMNAEEWCRKCSATGVYGPPSCFLGR